MPVIEIPQIGLVDVTAGREEAIRQQAERILTRVKEMELNDLPIEKMLSSAHDQSLHSARAQVGRFGGDTNRTHTDLYGLSLNTKGTFPTLLTTHAVHSVEGTILGHVPLATYYFPNENPPQQDFENFKNYAGIFVPLPTAK